MTCSRSLGFHLVVRCSAGSAQKGEDGEHAPVGRLLGAQPKFGEDRGNVGFHRLGTEEEYLPDAGVGPALGHECQYVALSIGQGVKSRLIASSRDEAGDDCRVDDAVALSEPSERVEKCGCVRESVFEQVPHGVV
jgi:hypothetical protein